MPSPRNSKRNKKMDTSFPAMFFKFAKSLCGQPGFPVLEFGHKCRID